ncbi:hypothetical protein IP87_17330 [beta proteobacterium AAP121]|nr:hypothetical protein IP80_19630 [beta proteobacterium AAP65]KPF95190.1 hypothetical protein IP87_17330 [beta proteobacterium AAP121]
MALLLWVMAVGAAAQAPPNILLIIADDMGIDMSRCHALGKDGPALPNLQALCASGLVFDNAYSAPVCSPTRATIMTGRYGFRTGIGAALSPRGSKGLAADGSSLFDVLGRTAYSSALIGKWHLASGDQGLDHPRQLGVKHYFGIYSGAVRDFFDWDAIDNGQSVKVSGYATTVLTDRAIDWVGAQKQPWFLWLAYNAPHAPFHLPPTALHRAGDLPTDAASIRANPRPYYVAALQALDSEIGRLLASLPADARRNTWVIFIGDNGTPGQIARDTFGPQRAKGSIFEGGTHVPLIIAGPGVKPGRASGLVNTTDLYATIAALAGAGAGTPDSVDLTPVLKGGSSTRSHVYVEHFSAQRARGADVLGWAIRDARHKLVVPEQSAPMLFDLQMDPLERTDLLAGNVSSASLQKAHELREAYDKLRKSHP